MLDDAVVAQIKRKEQDSSIFSEERVAKTPASEEVSLVTFATASVRIVEARDPVSSATAREVITITYADDIRRIHHRLHAFEADARKPDANERLAVARSAAYARGDFDQVSRLDAQAAHRQETKRVARRRRKARRASGSGGDEGARSAFRRRSVKVSNGACVCVCSQ